MMIGLPLVLLLGSFGPTIRAILWCYSMLNYELPILARINAKMHYFEPEI